MVGPLNYLDYPQNQQQGVLVAANLPPNERIVFHHFVIPFVQLITEALVRKICVAGDLMLNVCGSVFSIGLRIHNASSVVFDRLVYEASYNPASPEFQQLLNSYEQQIVGFKQQIQILEDKFGDKHSLARDLAALRKLDEDIVGINRELGDYIYKLKGRVNRLPVQEKLDQLKKDYENLNHLLEASYRGRLEYVFDDVFDVINYFINKDVQLPKDVSNQLIEMQMDCKAICSKHHNLRYHFIFDKIDQLMSEWINSRKTDEITEPNLVGPLKLRNIGNSCYFDSVLQAALCINFIREKLKQPPDLANIQKDVELYPYLWKEKNKEDVIKDRYEKTCAIQKELAGLMTKQEKRTTPSQMTLMELMLYLREENQGGGGSVSKSLIRLRDAVFTSGFHQEFANIKSKASQHDAGAFAELLIEYLLPEFKLECDTHAIVKHNEEYRAYKMRTEPVSMLQLGVKDQREYQSLSTMIRIEVGQHVEKDRYKRWDQNEGELLQEVSEAVVNAYEKTRPDEGYYIRWNRFKKLPSFLVVQAKRFETLRTERGFQMAKNNNSVYLPEDGIIDLSQYYQPPGEEEPVNARYKVKSMVIHSGGLHGGHYVAKTEIEGKYYLCDDMAENKEITEKDFLGTTDGYLYFLERLPDEEPAIEG